MGQLRLSFSLAASGDRQRFDVSCPTVNAQWCATEGTVPVHQRTLSIGLIDLTSGIAVGLGRGVALELRLPLRMTVFSLEHTLDGAPYDVPYPLFTAEDEVLVGPGDLQFLVRYVNKLPGSLMLTGQLGLSLPTGMISPNPFDPNVPASQATHRQFGTGTVDPLLRLSAAWAPGPVGLLARMNLRLGLYPNVHGFQTGNELTLAAGPTFFPTAGLEVLVQVNYQHSQPARWDGLKAPNSGSDRLSITTALNGRIADRWWLGGSVSFTPLARMNGEQFQLPVAAGVNLTGVLLPPRRENQRD